MMLGLTGRLPSVIFCLLPGASSLRLNRGLIPSKNLFSDLFGFGHQDRSKIKYFPNVSVQFRTVQALFVSAETSGSFNLCLPFARQQKPGGRGTGKHGSLEQAVLRLQKRRRSSMDKGLFVGIKISSKLQNALDSPAPGTARYFKEKNLEYLEIVTLGTEKIIGRFIKDGFPASDIDNVSRNVRSIVSLITRGHSVGEDSVHIYANHA
jgi:hypothetical protein